MYKTIWKENTVFRYSTHCHHATNMKWKENNAYGWVKTYSSQRQGSVSGLVIGVGN